jgi:pimeloyl-ACP methyl ester carboxylesterase
MVNDKNTQYLVSNDLRLAYQDFGKPEDPVILLVAGLNNQMVRWPLALCDLLVSRGYRVIRFDNRDIGLSEKMEGVEAPGVFRLFLKHYLRIPVDAPYSLDDMAEDAVGVLDALNIDHAHIVGMSMGGMISQLVAAHYPQRIRSLTSIMSTSGEWGKGVASLKVSRQMLRPVSKDRTALENGVDTWRMIGSPGYPLSEREIEAILRAEYKRSSNPAGYLRQIAAVRTAPGRATLLSKLVMPVLIIHGREDLLVPVSGGIDTAKHIPHATLKIFDGMGHDLPKELLPEFTDLIVENTKKADL